MKNLPKRPVPDLVGAVASAIQKLSLRASQRKLGNLKRMPLLEILSQLSLNLDSTGIVVDISSLLIVLSLLPVYLDGCYRVSSFRCRSQVCVFYSQHDYMLLY